MHAADLHSPAVHALLRYQESDRRMTMFYKSVTAAFWAQPGGCRCAGANVHALCAGFGVSRARLPLISWPSTRVISPMPVWR